MENLQFSKNHTGLCAEYAVASELYRRGYNVSMMLGNTKSIDLVIECNDQTLSVQVKGIRSRKSICWNLKRGLISPKVLYVFVNINYDKLNAPMEYYLLKGEEALENVKTVKSGRDYIDISYVKKLHAKDAWEKVEELLNSNGSTI